MNVDHFQTLLRSLSASPSRRTALRLLTGLVLGSPLALGSAGVDAHDAARKCKKREGQAKKQCLKKAKKHRARHRQASAPPVPVLTYQCSGPADYQLNYSSPGTSRLTQTFTAAQSGSLRQIQFEVSKDAGSTGNYVVQLLAAADGLPTNMVLAEATIPNASVPDGISMLTAGFTGPALVAGTEYAAAVSRPGGNSLRFNNRKNNACVGKAFAQNPSGTGQFSELAFANGLDLITAVTVLV